MCLYIVVLYIQSHILPNSDITLWYARLGGITSSSTHRISNTTKVYWGCEVVWVRLTDYIIVTYEDCMCLVHQNNYRWTGRGESVYTNKNNQKKCVMKYLELISFFYYWFWRFCFVWFFFCNFLFSQNWLKSLNWI